MTVEHPVEAKARIRRFLAPVFRSRELKDTDDIFAPGIVTSLFAMELVLFVEKEFSITIDSEDLEIDNFRTIDAIAALVERKTCRGRASAPEGSP